MNKRKCVALCFSAIMCVSICSSVISYQKDEIEEKDRYIPVTASEPGENFWIYPEPQPYQIFSAPQFNWSKYWQTFKSHAMWNLEYNQGSGWISCKEALTIIRDYLEDNTCKFTLDFTVPHTADYRLTLAIDYRVKKYINRSAQYEYTLTYEAYNESFNVIFNWSDIAEIPGIVITHGVKEVGGHDYFWLRARRDNVPQNTHVYLDPTYEVESVSQIFNEYNSQRKLARNSTGTYWVCYEKFSDVYVAYSDDDGQTWTNVLVFGADVSGKPSIIIDSNDITHLVWSGQHAGQPTYNQIRYSNSSDWTNIVNLTNISNYQYYPSMAIDSSDNIHIVWENTTPQGASNDDQVSYINSTDGGVTWSPIQMLTNETNSGDDIWYPMIAVNNTDSLHVIFQCEDFALGWDQILHMQSDDGGITWSAWDGDAITNDGSHNQLNPCLAIDDDDTLYITWVGEQQANIKHQIGYSYNDSSGWSTAEWLTDDSVDNQYYPSISIDEMGFVHIIWRDGTSSAIHYKYNNTVSWSDEVDLTDTGADINPSILHSQTPTIDGLKTNTPAVRFVFTYVYGSLTLYFTDYSVIWRKDNYPVPYNPQPIIEETGVSMTLSQFNISISDPNGDTMNLTFRTNESGTWQDINATLTNQANGTYNATNVSWINWGTKYWWSVNLTDGTYWSNQTYYFTVEADANAPEISGLLPSHQNMTQTSPVTLSVTLDDPEDNTMTLNWMNGKTNTVMSTNSSISDGTYTYEWNCGEGTHQWYINITDSFGNSNESSIYWFVCNSTWSDDFYNHVLIDGFDSNYVGARVVVQMNSSYANFTSDLYNNTVAEGLDGTERTIYNSMWDSTDDYGASPRIVFINTTHGYAFGASSTVVGSVAWFTTTDGGITWVHRAEYGNCPNGCYAGAVWYDQWTTGDTGTKIHIATTSGTDDDLVYNYFDTALGTENANWVTVWDATTIAPPDGGAVITKSTDGRLWIGAMASDPLGGKIFYSDDDGATWTEKTPTSYFNDDDDHMQLLPLPDGDVMCLYQDASTTYLGYTIYDKSIDSWSSFTQVASIPTTKEAGFSASIWKQTGDIYLSYYESSEVRFQKYTITNNTWWGEITLDITGNYHYDTSTVVSQGNGDIYVFWSNGTFGLTDVFCSNSTDEGATWSTPQQISTTQDDLKYTTGNFMSYYKIYASWRNDDLNDWIGTTVRNYTLGAKITDAYSNMTSINITKPSGYWSRFNCDVNTTADTTFSILDENGTAQLTGLDGNNNDISSVTNSTIKLWGQFNDTRNMDSWNVSWTAEAPANNIPTASGQYPSNGTTDVPLNPTVAGIVTDTDSGETINITWQSNYSDGSTWVTYQNNFSVASNTNVTWDTTGKFNTDNTEYWWKVYLHDGTDNVSYWYSFTTASNITIDEDVHPDTWLTGNVDLGLNIQENFTFWQNGSVTIDITIGINDTNFTFVNYTGWLNLGHDRYCANFTTDNWDSENMTEPGYPPTSVLNSSFAPGSFTFGVRIWMPRTVTYSGKREDFEIVLVVSESS